MFHFLSETMRLIVASLASMQYPKNIGFDERKLSVMIFRNNLLET